ncbi:MAG: hypothetical protein FJX89_00925 [Bacteroidetes bacterium]|nr:hypothetical protein [Bacteroidota bacterium]
MLVPFENNRQALENPDAWTEQPCQEEIEEQFQEMIRKQLELWQIDADLQEVLYRGTSLDRKN